MFESGAIYIIGDGDRKRAPLAERKRTAQLSGHPQHCLRAQDIMRVAIIKRIWQTDNEVREHVRLIHLICLGTFKFSSEKSHYHGRGLMTSSLVLLMMNVKTHMQKWLPLPYFLFVFKIASLMRMCYLEQDLRGYFEQKITLK